MKINRLVNNSPPSIPNSRDTVSVIKQLYSDSNPAFFDAPPNCYDKKYIIGTIRYNSLFSFSYVEEKIKIKIELWRLYSSDQFHFNYVKPGETNTARTSWETVISGQRPMGQFSVETLYSPLLHALAALPNIGVKVFKKENNKSLYMIVIYRRDSEYGEKYAIRYIELYHKKRAIMNEIVGNYQLKVYRSELAIAKDMGEIFSYEPEAISQYIEKLTTLIEQTTS